MPPIISTRRLILRPFTLEDARPAFEVFEGHPDVWKYDPGYQRTYEQRAALIARYSMLNDPDSVGTLALTRKDDNLLIGYVGLQFYILPRDPLATPEVELYYKLGHDFWNQGFATEACQALVEFAFRKLRLKRLVTIASQENENSLRLMRRLGMSLEPAPAAWPNEIMGTLKNQYG